MSDRPAALRDRIRMEQRDKLPERMDDPELDAEAHYAALRGLSRLNWLSRTAQTLWHELCRLSPARSDRPIRILDLACGGGDITMRLSRIAHLSGRNIAVDGCDLSSRAIRYASEAATGQGLPCRFFRLDVVEGPLPTEYDFFVTSLFLHHLPTELVPSFLRKMARSSCRGFVVDDLRRSVGGYLLAAFFSRVVSRSPVVHEDALLSVRAAFTVAEVKQFLVGADTDLNGSRLRSCFPFRFLLSWSKDEADAV